MARYRFVGTPLSLDEREAYHLHKYLKKGRQSGRIVTYEKWDIDLEALLTPVQLDCANCHQAHHESCCEGGFPFPPEHSLLPVLNEHAEPILTGYLGEKTAQHVRENGLFRVYPETEGHPTVTMVGENCAFCIIEGNGPACMAHRYALDIGVLPEEIKPLSCLLYPLDLIEDQETGRVLITALTEHTVRFSRWGEDYFRDFLCANQEGRRDVAEGRVLRDNIRKEVPADAFALDKYRPAYQEGKATLLAHCGEPLWQWIDEQARGHLQHHEEREQR